MLPSDLADYAPAQPPGTMLPGDLPERLVEDTPGQPPGRPPGTTFRDDAPGRPLGMMLPGNPRDGTMLTRRTPATMLPDDLPKDANGQPFGRCPRALSRFGTRIR